MSKIGPKEAQIRALREAKYDQGVARAKAAEKPKVVKKLPPMEHPEGEPVVGAVLSKPSVKELQAKADAVKKRGRPAKHTPEERKALRAELMRKKRAAEKGGSE